MAPCGHVLERSDRVLRPSARRVVCLARCLAGVRSPYVVALMANNYAFAVYMLNDSTKLEAADVASAKALDLAPKNQVSSVPGERSSLS